MLMGVDEPMNYQQASKMEEWRRAMEQELEAVDATDFKSIVGGLRYLSILDQISHML